MEANGVLSPGQIWGVACCSLQIPSLILTCLSFLALRMSGYLFSVCYVHHVVDVMFSLDSCLIFILLATVTDLDLPSLHLYAHLLM